MTVRTPPSWLQNGSHPAENDRLSTQAIFSSSGVVRSADMAVTQSVTPGMSVVVAGGYAAIVGTYQTNMGVYMAFNDAALTVSLNPADPTNPRIDRIVVTINDAYYSGATNNVTIGVVTGVAAASPTAPAIPTNSISLATIAVAAATTSILNANITDTRVRAAMYEHVVTTSTPTGVPLIIQVASGQTGNALQVKNAAGTVVGFIDSAGNPQGTLATSAGFNPLFLIGA